MRGGGAVAEPVVDPGGTAERGLFLHAAIAVAAEPAGEDGRVRTAAQRDRDSGHVAVVAAPARVALAAGRDVVGPPAERGVGSDLEIRVGAAQVAGDGGLRVDQEAPRR